MLTTKIDLPEVLRRARDNGPTRVMVSASGRAVTPEQALREHAIVPDVIFVRFDGWTLGAPDHLSGAAYSLWAQEWVAWFVV